jgi:4-amino-4-deoxy-L-arabinose transferase
MLKQTWRALGALTVEGGWQRHRNLMWAAVLTGLVLISFAGNMNRGLLETTEGRYAECAREMLETGNFLEPTLDYTPHWTKPPMAYWSMTAGMALAGANEPGARMGNAVAFICTGLLTAWLAWRLWGQLAGMAALAVYTTSVLPVLGSTFLSTDMLLTLWETLAVACYLLWFNSPRTSRTLLAVMWAVFGLAFLTKGPPGLLPLLAIIPWHVWRFRDGRVFHPGGLALFALLGLGWFGFIIWKHPDLLSYYVREEVVGRMASDAFNRNPQWYKPLVIYAPVLFLGQIHWAWLAQSPKSVWLALPRELRSFLGLWAGLPLIVFCLAKSRLPLYVLPLSIPLTLCIAHGLVQHRERLKLRTTAVIFTGAILITAGARVILGVVPMHQNMRQLHAGVTDAGSGQIVALVKEKAYGLQFYADGKVAWLGTEGGKRADALDTFLDNASGRYRLVARMKDKALVEDVFRSHEVSPSVHDLKDWIVLSFEK